MRPLRTHRILGLALAAFPAARASAYLQAGDRQGEVQAPLPADLAVPRADPLSLEQELARLRLPAELVIEAVAAEPLVQAPVALAFDADGSLLVVEMSAYMSTLDGQHEREALGSVVRLIDSDGDTRFDRRVVVLDRLVLPRAVAAARGGVLVIAPPQLIHARDEDGDGFAEEQQVVDRGLTGLDSPEHAINALLPTLDNAWHCANVPWRYIHDGNTWKRQPIAAGGQWGATQDQLGRIYYNTNSDPLRMDRLAPTDAVRNPNYGIAKGMNTRVVDDVRPAPARMTPGINRGYEPGMLDAQYRLTKVTAVCAPLVLRGPGLGTAWQQRALVCEPAGNLILAYQLTQAADGSVRGVPLRNSDGLDFLTSTDERFRPVFACEGPDGAVYIADMARGLIQHRLFVTSFLRQQVLERGLEQPLHQGRIWRIRSRAALPPVRSLAAATPAQLVEALESSIPWARESAQRLLIEDYSDSAKAHAALRTCVLESKQALARVHALWTLHGMGSIRAELVHQALRDTDPRVRCAALRTSEALCAKDPTILERWRSLAQDPDPQVRLARLCALGNVRTPAALQELADAFDQHLQDPFLCSVLWSGLGGREWELLQLWSARESWQQPSAAQAEQLSMAARCIVREGTSERIEALLELWLNRTAWRPALQRGCEQARRRGQERLSLSREPRAARDPRFATLRALFAWPGSGDTAGVAVRPLDLEEQRSFERGRVLYTQTCAACHLPSGAGMPGIAPSLVGSEWVLGDPLTTLRILLHGLRGELTIDGERFDGDMPAVGANDEELASILTYIRREWGNAADPVRPQWVSTARAAEAPRSRAWTVTELQQLQKPR